MYMKRCQGSLTDDQIQHCSLFMSAAEHAAAGSGRGILFLHRGRALHAAGCRQQRQGRKRIAWSARWSAARPECLLLALEQQFHIQGTLAHDILVSAGILVIIYVPC